MIVPLSVQSRCGSKSYIWLWTDFGFIQYVLFLVLLLDVGLQSLLDSPREVEKYRSKIETSDASLRPEIPSILVPLSSASIYDNQL